MQTLSWILFLALGFGLWVALVLASLHDHRRLREQGRDQERRRFRVYLG